MTAYAEFCRAFHADFSRRIARDTLFSRLHSPSRAPLQIGLASRDITPPLGYRLAGYFFERLATAVHDPLRAKAIVFKQGEARFALVVCDLCQTSPEVVAQARSLASEKTGIPADHICIASTHTHTGPDYFGVLAEHLHRIALEAHDGVDPARTFDYPSFLTERIVEAIVEADASVAPAAIAFGSAPQPNVAFNRRYLMKDGTVAWNPGKMNPKIERPAGPIDANLSVLTIERGQKLAAVLTNFPLHPDTAGGTEYSADYPGYIESTLRAQLQQPHLMSVFAQGTSGNINHVDVSTNRPQSGPQESERIGRAIGQRIIDSALAHATPLDRPSLAVATARIDLPVQQYPPEEVAKARELFAKIQERKLPFLIGVRATKIVKIDDRHHGQPIAAQVQALRLSDDAAIVMVPSELFVEFGLAIKARSPFTHTLVIELANDSFGYVPTKRAFEEGAYEPTNSVIQPGGGERLVELAIGLLEKLKR
ncbi:MAG: hypothetical protein JWN40_2514 [Phycisphaerales bacterium]|nr:hypothetical protein [Phycisphaerales bacterium]